MSSRPPRLIAPTISPGSPASSGNFIRLRPARGSPSIRMEAMRRVPSANSAYSIAPGRVSWRSILRTTSSSGLTIMLIFRGSLAKTEGMSAYSGCRMRATLIRFGASSPAKRQETILASSLSVTARNMAAFSTSALRSTEGVVPDPCSVCTSSSSSTAESRSRLRSMISTRLPSAARRREI